MRTYKTKSQTKTIVATDKIYCDWCKEEFDDTTNQAYEGTEFPTDTHTEAEFKLVYQVSTSSYPDWTGTVGFEVEDLCPKCAEKLYKLLYNAGLNVKEINL